MERPSIRIALQKSGRLRAGSIKFLKQRGINVPSNVSNGFVVSCGDNVEVLFVRYGDIPEYVSGGAADYGIVGENLLYEESNKVSVISKLGFGQCKLVLAVPRKSQIKDISDLEGERIATSYPHSLRKFLRKNRLGAAVVNIRGSVEAAPAIGLADAICDLTQTGETLKANNLRIVSEVLSSEAALIASNSPSGPAKEFMDQLIGEEL